jgi:hypothetical protein
MRIFPEIPEDLNSVFINPEEPALIRFITLNYIPLVKPKVQIID